MNPSLRAIKLRAGVTLATASPGLTAPHERHRSVPYGTGRTRDEAMVKRSDDTGLWIAEPPRFHRARYEHLRHTLRGKCHLAAALLSCLILIMLICRASVGEFISPERWLCGGLSGWFIVCMSRLALFTCLAAPRYICHAQGTLRISGLGTLRPGQIRRWSMERAVMSRTREKPGVRIQLCCRWLGWAWNWSMLMEEGPETERLRRLLEAAAPHSADAELRLNRTIPIEA